MTAPDRRAGERTVPVTAALPGGASDSARPAPAAEPRPIAIPDREAMRRWLLSDAILGADGSVRSWENPCQPGYPYPEAAGLLLSTIGSGLCGEADVAAIADRTAGWICGSLLPQGGVGRAGIAYLFDAGVVLSGLLRYRAAGGRVGGDAPIHHLRAFVGEQIAAGAAVVPQAAMGDGRWSTQFGAHLVKCLQGLQLYACAFDTDVPEALVTALINRSGHQPSPTYIHPFCYEQEGHLIAAQHGLTSLFEPVDGALDWLAALQQPDGALLAFANGMEGFGESRTDSTAQAIRLWLLRDRRRYAEPIARAFAFLARCQTPHGGIRYTAERDDVCSWATMFALQATTWLVDGPRLDALL